MDIKNQCVAVSVLLASLSGAVLANTTGAIVSVSDCVFVPGKLSNSGNLELSVGIGLGVPTGSIDDVRIYIRTDKESLEVRNVRGALLDRIDLPTPQAAATEQGYSVCGTQKSSDNVETRIAGGPTLR